MYRDYIKNKETFVDIDSFVVFDDIKYMTLIYTKGKRSTCTRYNLYDTVVVNEKDREMKVECKDRFIKMFGDKVDIFHYRLMKKMFVK
jgi:hypothetical protein